MDRLTEMEVFIAVVDESGFTQAANKLGLSKSAVSKHIAGLEDRLGVALLNRTTRKVSPTEIGREFYAKANEVILQAKEAELSAKSFQKTPKGRLRVSVPSDFSINVLGPIVADFLKLYPELSLELSLNNEFVDLTGDGYDAAIRIGELPDSTLMARKLAKTNIAILGSPDYFKTHGRPETADDLLNHKLLGYSQTRGQAFWRFDDGGGKRHILPAGDQLAVNNGSLLCQAAEQGMGLVASPCFIYAKPFAEGLLEKAKIPLKTPYLDIHVVYPPASYTQPKLRSFIDFMVERFAKLGQENWDL